MNSDSAFILVICTGMYIYMGNCQIKLQIGVRKFSILKLE